MNWSVAIFAVLVLLMTGGWYGEVRKKFKGPAAVAHGIEDEISSA
jgi:hypothetical protein